MNTINLFSYSITRTVFIAIITCASINKTQAQQTIQHYLSGTDKDHTVQWDFFCTKGMNSG
ncbi:MAG: hypothetical protein ABIN97_15200, partial [Ginsengibacter sp.]